MKTHTLLRSAVTVAAATTLALAVSACAPSGAETPREPHIVVTTGVFGDIVDEIVGEHVGVSVLIPSGSDPHDFAPSSQDIHTLHTADLVVAVGAGFEEALETHLHSASQDGVPVFELARHVDTRETEELYGSHDEDRAHDHEHDHDDHVHEGHDHGPIDPHFWHDPMLVDQAVQALAEEIGTIEGVDVAAIQAHADRYRESLATLDDELGAMFAEIPEESRVLITQHHVLGYLAERYGFTTGGAIIPSTSTLAQSSASELNALVDTITNVGVPAVFTDVTQSGALAQTIAGELDERHGFTVVELYTESLSTQGGEAGTYLDMMRLNGQRITDALAG